ncbi:MAG: hypothetical protein J6T99_11020 [Oscillospiraceae bacterium]|nr:hypothetical protein [Oscillospiraceae bacterium]
MEKYPIRDIRRDVVEETIHQWIIGRNAERDRAIVSRKLFDGITFEKLADEFDLSVRRTKTIVYRCYDIIFRHIP